MMSCFYRGLKVFFFYLAVLFVCRLVFCLYLHEYWAAESGWSELVTVLELGTRLSIQTAGILALVTLVPVWLTAYPLPRVSRYLEKGLSLLVLFVTSIGFMASFPYYRQFHSRFNQMVFNAGNDDLYALFISLVQEFSLPLRLLGAILLALALWKLLQYVLDFSLNQKTQIIYAYKKPVSIQRRLGSFFCALAFLYVLSRLVIFGGSWSWETALEWENVGVTNDSFMNEAILDDYQAVYRAYRMNNRLLACNGLNFTTEQIKLLAAELSGKEVAGNELDYYLAKRAQGAQLPKPKQIFLIVSESYANWPLLDKYSELHIADGMKELIAAPDSAYCPAMLPNGGSTISAMTGVTTGLADANLYLTTMPESFAQPYLTAIAPQIEALGYTSNFWYAGPESWERIGSFTKAQGFDHFYGRGDMPAEAEGSVWGCDDEYLYAQVLEKLSADDDSFNVILNVSNHSPYNVDVEAKGFDSEAVRKVLPEAAQNDDWLIRELGHYWYADRELAKFVKELKAAYPESLIIIVGDHADRYNIDKQPSMYERYAVPFIVTGQGVAKETLLPDSAGSQIDIVPTIIELIAPKDFTYYAIGSSLSRTNRQGVNYGFWVTRDYIGEADKMPLEPVAVSEKQDAVLDEPKLQNYIDAVRSISWYLPKYGLTLDERLLEDR